MSKRKQRKYRTVDSHWTANDVRAIIHNPVYVGLGPFPPLIDDAMWARAQEQAIRDDGLEAVLLQVRNALVETFGVVPTFMEQPGWVAAATKAYAEHGAHKYLLMLLQQLRVAYPDLT